jgi:hypothetical protein
MDRKEGKYASTPVWKLVRGFDNQDIPVYFDRQALSTDNEDFSASQLNFYPQQAATLPQANYQENPLPKNRGYDIPAIGIGFATNALLEQPGDSIGLVSMVNHFFNSRLLLETNQREKLLNRHIVEMLDLRTMGYDVLGTDDAGTDDGLARMVQFPIFRTLRLPEPISFDPRESFDINLKFHDDAGIPSDSEWSTFGQGPAEVIVAMQVSFDN